MLTLISVLLFFVSAGLLTWYFLKSDRGQKEPTGALFAAMGFGFLAVVLAFILELFLPNVDKKGVALGTLFFTSLGVGIIEESAKFVPLALFIKGKSYFNEHTDGIIYFAISGLTFGTIENLLYVLAYSSKLGGGQLTGIFRLIILFFFHAASTGIIGYYLAKSKIRHQSNWRPVIALATLATIHGLYDFLFFYGSYSANRGGPTSDSSTIILVLALITGLIISALLNTFLFLYFRRARQWDASIGLAYDPKLGQPAPVSPGV